MTSVSASAPPPAKQPCCVCGSATMNRCSKCAKFGFDIFFCSQPHQKLLWPAHRLVCGKNASPFRWPSLTDEHAEELLTIAMPSTTLNMVKLFSVNPREVPDVVNSLRTSYKGPPLYPDETLQNMLIVLSAIRRMTRLHRSGVREEDDTQLFYSKLENVPRLCALDAIAWDLRRFLGVDYQRYRHRPWWTPFLHKWMIPHHLTIVLSPCQTGEYIREIFELAKWANEEAIRFVQKEILPLDPEIVPALIEHFSDGLAEILKGLYG
ncbi:hypothetical protein JCM16303_003363 [Sporobolomyces ruberrimus]